MAVNVTQLIGLMDTFISDTSTDRITTNERYEFLTEAVTWLQQTLKNDHQNCIYNLDYLDTVHYYKVTTSIADLLSSADLRRKEDEHIISFAPKSAREIAEEIGIGFGESSFAIERRDGDAYVVINHQTPNVATVLTYADALDNDGLWVADTTNSDAINLTIDENDYVEGSSCFNFDVDVSQSGNNKATIYNSTLSSANLADFDSLSFWLMNVKFPSVVNISSVTIYWGTDSSNYWTSTSTTDIDGGSFITDWNLLKFAWSTATPIGTPTASNIGYFKIDINYTGSQTDATDFKIDFIRVAKPERLVFHYLSWKSGSNASGADIMKFTAGTDFPYFSGQYDQYKYPVAHKAASLAFASMRLYDESTREESEATKSIAQLIKIIPSSQVSETKSFKPKGINFRSKSRRRK